MAAQNSANHIKANRSNHIKARIDKTQQNSKCRLCSDRDETTGLEDLEVGDRVETIQTTALLKTARILRRVLET